MKTETPPTIRLADYRAPDYRILKTDLTFRLEPDATRVVAHLTLEATNDNAAALQLDGEELTFVSAAIDGRALAAGDYSLNDNGLLITAPPARFVLTTEVEISPARNSALSGLYVSDGMLCTQCEAEGFRRITWYLDRPDTMAVFTTRIEADRAAYPVLLSNGNLIDSGELPGGRHFAVWEDPFKKPAYLFALVAAQLGHIEDSFVTMSGRTVTLRVYVDPGNEPRAHYAMESLKRAMKWDEEAYGREYDLDIFMIVAVAAFNFGAMENKGLNIFNDKYVLADPETATDTDFELIEGIVGHEYFHNWSGNRVTCRDWFQLCLKEGFTVLRDQQFSEAMRSEAVQRIDAVKQLRARQFAEDAGPLAHPVRPESYIEIDNFYTATVYDKGAEVVRMLHTMLGQEQFRKASDLYFDRHDGEAATVEAFAKSFEDATGADLTQFRLWWSQAGTPVVSVETSYDAAAQTFDVTLRQSCPPTPGQPDKKPLELPIRLGLVGADGGDLPLQLDGENAPVGSERVLKLTGPEQTFRFVHVAERPVPSIARGFSAPVKVEIALSREDRAFLMGRDGDLFNRWEAGQQYAQMHLLELTAAAAAGTALTPDAALIDAYGRVLADADRDPAFAALALTLPSLSDLLQSMPAGEADAETAHKAKTALTTAIGQALRPALLDAYHRSAPTEAFQPDAEQSGLRALRNATLRLLTAEGDATAAELAYAQFTSATNMTDSIAALSVLSAIDHPLRADALAAFEARWSDNPLVMDKWMSVQAGSSLPGTLDEVKRLTGHKAFSMDNPNRFRALVSVFASANPLRFHAADGAGYRFVADQALAMDKVNPQVAARLFGVFESWRRFAPHLRAHMQREIERVAKSEGLSKNLFEIATRSLV
ncbi:Aminopeptidase N [Alphaproteobacteria bacterium SO-S41]|nr:Aminopeptidase N [Alphaproteobacteria bacterium SO-S41]